MSFLRHSLAATVLAWAGLAGAAGTHEAVAQHGGAVAQAQHLDYELVLRPDLVTLYVRDHGQAVDPQGGRARLTLLQGGEATELHLAPAEGRRLQAAGRFAPAPGSKAVVWVSLPGRKPASLRFAWP